MARTDLVSGNVWEQYSKKVQDRMNHPRALGELTEDDAKEKNGRLIVADFGAESCGDAVRLFWIVDESTDTIIDSKFKSFGCGTAIASSDAMAELCVGKTVDEAIHITNTEVEEYLRDEDGTPAVPPQKMHCSVMAYDVILEAASQYKGVDREKLVNQDIICECARVTKQEVIKAIKDYDLKTVEEIGEKTKAGTFCKSCIKPGGHEAKDVYLIDVLNDTREEMEKDKMSALADAKIAGTIEEIPFEDYTMVQKLKDIEEVIDTDIRPMLMMDGGNMEILDIKDTEEGTIDVYIRYMGACAGCASSSTGTLYAIESVLQQKLSLNIRVLPI